MSEASLLAHTDIHFHSSVYGADAVHSHVNVLERQRLTPKGNALVVELQRVAIAVDGEILAQVKAGGLGFLAQNDGLTILGGSNSLVESRIAGLANLCHGIGNGSLRLGSGGRLVAQGNGGDCGDGSVIAGRDVSIGDSVVSSVSGGILGIGGLGSGGSCGGQLVGVHRRGSEGAQRCDQARSDHGSGCARTVHLHFFSF